MAENLEASVSSQKRLSGVQSAGGLPGQEVLAKVYLDTGRAAPWQKSQFKGRGTESKI